MKKIVEEFVQQIEINRNCRKAKITNNFRGQMVQSALCRLSLCPLWNFLCRNYFWKKKVDEVKKNFLMRNFVLVILF